MSYTLVVEGNIASGKSSFLDVFEKTQTNTKNETQIFREPIDKWTNINGINLLDYYYKDTKRNAFSFESYIFLTMTQNHTQPLEQGKNIRLLERSIWSARNVFVESLYVNNVLRGVDYTILNEWYKYLIENEVKQNPSCVIFLKAPTVELLRRIRNRDRPEENKITSTYLTQLDQLYNIWVESLKQRNIPVVEIDTNNPLEDTLNLFTENIRWLSEDIEIQRSLSK